MKCPVCGKYNFPQKVTARVCPVCEWHDDLFQRKDHNCITDTNLLSVNEQRMEYYLLNTKKTASKTKRLQDKYYKKCDRADDAYPFIRKIAQADLYAQKMELLNAARIEYVDALNDLLLELLPTEKDSHHPLKPHAV